MNEKPYILSVDDEELNQLLIEELFQNDYTIGLVSDGQQCLDSVEKNIPNLILLDIDMPVLDGFETCKRLRENKKYKDIVILVVSAMATAEEIKKGFSVGCDDYVTKPYDLSELEEKVSSLLHVA